MKVNVISTLMRKLALVFLSLVGLNSAIDAVDASHCMPSEPCREISFASCYTTAQIQIGEKSAGVPAESQQSSHTCHLCHCPIAAPSNAVSMTRLVLVERVPSGFIASIVEAELSLPFEPPRA